MDKFLTFTVTGVSQAAVYAIAACGLVVTYTTSGIFNFAHGAIGMMAAFTYWQFHTGWGWGALPSVLIVVLVVAPLFGAVVERLIMRGLTGASEAVRIVVTVSLMLTLLGLGNVIWPSSIGRSNLEFFSGAVSLGGVNVSYQRILILVLALVVAIVLRVILYRTRFGITMRAVVDDRPLVQLNGGRPDRASMIAWALGAALAAIAGILVSPSSVIGMSQLQLTLLVVSAFGAAVVGRLKSLPMAFVGALFLGLTEAYAGGYLASGRTLGGFALGNLRYAISPIILFIVMVVQPQERLRTGGVQRVREHWAVPSMRLALGAAASLVIVTVAISELLPADSDLIPVVPAFFFALVALSLVPLTGWAGQVSLAQLSFAGIGGVVMAVVGPDATLLGLVAAIVVCAAVGALIALPALRLSGIYLALATTTFALVMSRVIFNQPKVMPGGNRQIPALDLGFIKIDTNERQVVLMAVVFALASVGLVSLRRSAMGRRLAAMKDSPVACATLGLNLTRTKIAVFALSASIAGLSGALWSRTIISTNFELPESMTLTMLAVVGGVGAVGGAFFGGMLMGTFSSLAPSLFANNAVGYFKSAELSVSSLTQITPGFAGIGLGRNPSGAFTQMADAYRSASKSRAALSITVAVPAVLWGLARSGAIENWTFTASIAVFVLGIVPLLAPAIEAMSARGAVTLAWMAVVLVAVTAIDWNTAIGSTGMKFVVMVGVALVSAPVAVGLLGTRPDIPGLAPSAEPSPDLLGVDRPLTRSDVVEAEVVLGLRESDFDVVA